MAIGKSRKKAENIGWKRKNSDHFTMPFVRTVDAARVLQAAVDRFEQETNVRLYDNMKANYDDFRQYVRSNSHADFIGEDYFGRIQRSIRQNQQAAVPFIKVSDRFLNPLVSISQPGTKRFSDAFPTFSEKDTQPPQKEILAKASVPDLGQWLGKQVLLGGIGLVGIIGVLLIFSLSPAPLMSTALFSLFSALACITAVWVFIESRKLQPEQSEDAAHQRGIKAEKRFMHYWAGLWISWGVLYALLPIEGLGLLKNFANNLSALWLGMMYWELAEETIESAGKSTITFVGLLFLVVGLAVVEKVSGDADSQLFDYLSSLFVGGMTILLCLRFNSKLLAVPKFMIWGMVLYGLIQPVWPLINQNIQTPGRISPELMFVIAFAAKLLLLVLVQWLLESGRMLYYMTRMPELLRAEAGNRKQMLPSLMQSRRQSRKGAGKG
ncbi:MAG: hypothetical protein AAF206_18515 [Bacteroidota bacterium]